MNASYNVGGSGAIISAENKNNLGRRRERASSAYRDDGVDGGSNLGVAEATCEIATAELKDLQTTV